MLCASLSAGMVVLKTRCLECECCTARKEDFQDVSIPVPSRKKMVEEGEIGGNGDKKEVLSDDDGKCAQVM